MKHIAIVRHVDYKRLGHIPELLEELGCEVQHVSLALGEALPELDTIDGVITMGGPMGAYQFDEYPWIHLEEAYAKQLVEAGIPLFGVCLGGQILAQAYGATVAKTDGYEMGWIQLERTAATDADPVFGDLEVPPLFQLHFDAMTLPEGAVNLLRSDKTEVQCFRMAEKAYGIQFHPEATEEMLQSVFEEYQVKVPVAELEGMMRDLPEKVVHGRAFLKEVLKRLFL